MDPYKWKREAEERIIGICDNKRKIQRDTTLLILKMGEEDLEPRNVGGSKGWKWQGNRFFQKSSQKECSPASPLIFDE